MKLKIGIIILLLFFQSNLFADENLIEFKIAYENEKPNTFLHNNNNIGKLYIENQPVLSLNDITSAKLDIDDTETPLWLKTAIESTSAKLIEGPSIRIIIAFNEQGKDKLSKITSQNIGRRLPVFFNNKLLIAPTITEKIDGGEILISSAFEKEEAQSMVDRINHELKNMKNLTSQPR